MARRRGDAELQVRASFEATRTAAQCLSAAYERLLPGACRTIRAAAPNEMLPDVAVPEPSRRRRAERG